MVFSLNIAPIENNAVLCTMLFLFLVPCARVQKLPDKRRAERKRRRNVKLDLFLAISTVEVISIPGGATSYCVFQTRFPSMVTGTAAIATNTVVQYLTSFSHLFVC